ncbi:porin [Halomonas sp. HK25]|uniref:porin n=1 Tax=Halomonas sp. HK25 TaxID=3394321 RepID=UPI0039FCE309
MKFYKRLAATLFSVGAMGVGVAQSDTPRVDVSPYGQVNLGYMLGETGEGTESYIVDNLNSMSRIGTWVRGSFDDTGITVGAHIELGYVQNPSNAVSPDNRNISGEFRDRQLNIFVEGDYGKFSLGQGDGAANNNTIADLSGTNVVSFTNPAVVGGGLPFVDRTTGEGVSLRNAVSNLDFEGRYSRIRYDAPSIGPVDFSMSHGVKSSSDVTEVGARFSAPVAGRLIARIGYSVRDVGDITGDVETVGGSVSWLHDSGVSLTAAYSESSDDNVENPRSSFYWGKAGYRINEYHAVDIHYSETSDLSVRGDRAESVGVGYVYTPNRWLDVYAGYRNHALSRVEADYDDVNVLMLGSRIRF